MIDNLLPYQFRALMIQLFAVIGTFVVVAYSALAIIFVYIPLMIFYYIVQVSEHASL